MARVRMVGNLIAEGGLRSWFCYKPMASGFAASVWWCGGGSEGPPNLPPVVSALAEPGSI